MCSKRQTFPPTGLYNQGIWFCSDKCRQGGRCLATFDEIIDMLRVAFGDNPEVVARIKDSVGRSMESL